MGRGLAEAMGETEARRDEALSRLPEMPAMMSQVAPPRMAVAAMPAHPSLAGPPLQQHVTPPGGAHGPSGTLASSPASPRVTEPPPPPPVHIQSLAKQGETLPSNDFPILDPVASGVPRVGGGHAGGVRGWLVAVIGVSALAVGFGLGFAVRGLI